MDKKNNIHESFLNSELFKRAVLFLRIQDPLTCQITLDYVVDMVPVAELSEKYSLVNSNIYARLKRGREMLTEFIYGDEISKSKMEEECLDLKFPRITKNVSN